MAGGGPARLDSVIHKAKGAQTSTPDVKAFGGLAQFDDTSSEGSLLRRPNIEKVILVIGHEFSLLIHSIRVPRSRPCIT